MTLPRRLRHRLFKPVIQPLLHVFWRWKRPMTLGAFALVVDGHDRVFLVKHSYVAGWHLPGGGVEKGESVLAALARELVEEGNIKLTATPTLHGVFFNKRVSRRDHVALFVVRDFHQEAPPEPNREIVDHAFFPFDALPEDIGRAARARIAEVFKGVTVSELW